MKFTAIIIIIGSLLTASVFAYDPPRGLKYDQSTEEVQSVLCADTSFVQDASTFVEGQVQITSDPSSARRRASDSTQHPEKYGVIKDSAQCIIFNNVPLIPLSTPFVGYQSFNFAGIKVIGYNCKTTRIIFDDTGHLQGVEYHIAPNINIGIALLTNLQTAIAYRTEQLQKEYAEIATRLSVKYGTGPQQFTPANVYALFFNNTVTQGWKDTDGSQVCLILNSEDTTVDILYWSNEMANKALNNIKSNKDL